MDRRYGRQGKYQNGMPATAKNLLGDKTAKCGE